MLSPFNKLLTEAEYAKFSTTLLHNNSFNCDFNLFIYAAYDITGSLFGKVKIIELEEYGGVTVEHLINLEIWRLLTSQLIHVKQIHMLFNVLSFLILGIYLERHIGCVYMFILWFVAGSVGTIFSTLFVTSPWNLGTGASQAIMGVAAFGVLLSYKKYRYLKRPEICHIFRDYSGIIARPNICTLPEARSCISFCCRLSNWCCIH